MPLYQFSIPHPRILLPAPRLTSNYLHLLPLPPPEPLDLLPMLYALPLHLPGVLLPRESELLLVLPLDVVEGPLEVLLLRGQLDMVTVLLRLLVELDLGTLQVQLLDTQVVQLVVKRVEGFGWRPLRKGEA